MNTPANVIAPGAKLTKLDVFLKTSIEDPDEFGRALMGAARELRAAELKLDVAQILFEGDTSALVELNRVSLRRASGAFGGTAPFDIDGNASFDIPAHLKKVARQWSATGKATLFRGTRLPEPAGSFGFGIHVTPQIDIAGGYAGGDVNSGSGTGRLLNRHQIGFINAYEVELTDKTYKNFQYEDSLSDARQAPTMALCDLHRQMQDLSQREPELFHIGPHGNASEALNEWSALSGSKQHYEVVLSDQHHPSSTYLRHAAGLIKVNFADPKWNQLLARIQEASLRDFYEIRPLDKALQSLTQAQSRAQGDAQKTALIESVRQWIQEERTARMNAPWEADSMKDVALGGSDYLAKRPYIGQSERVGSSMERSRVMTAPDIEKWGQICECLQIDDCPRAIELIGEVRPNSPGDDSMVHKEEAAGSGAGADDALLQTALDRSALCARDQAGASLMRLNAVCRLYGTGRDISRAAYEALSQLAYLAAYDLRTYGETCACLGVLPAGETARIANSASALLARAQDHESDFLSDSLSPAAVFYDDLYQVDLLLQPHAPARLLRYESAPTDHRPDALPVPSI